MAKERIDFVTYGYRCAIRGLESPVNVAEEVADLYGENARFEFETGVALAGEYHSKKPFEPVMPKEVGINRKK